MSIREASVMIMSNTFEKWRTDQNAFNQDRKLFYNKSLEISKQTIELQKEAINVQREAINVQREAINVQREAMSAQLESIKKSEILLEVSISCA
jgi:hypothetical protein